MKIIDINFRIYENKMNCELFEKKKNFDLKLSNRYE